MSIAALLNLGKHFALPIVTLSGITPTHFVHPQSARLQLLADYISDEVICESTGNKQY